MSIGKSQCITAQNLVFPFNQHCSNLRIDTNLYKLKLESVLRVGG